VQSFSEVKRGSWQGSSMVPEADNTVKKGTLARVVKGGDSRWRSKMTKGNWVGGPNARMDQTDDWAGQKNMAENMRWVER
jgi:hypothetical protein